MIKYKDSYIVFEEIPDEVSLALNITNCANNCIGCHSPELALNIGEELTEEILDNLIDENYGITCVLFMGEGRDQKRLLELANHIREKYPDLKLGIYSGRENVENTIYNTFDYVKTGPYMADYGPLNKETTNQRMYHMIDGEKIDITSKFWNRKE